MLKTFKAIEATHLVRFHCPLHASVDQYIGVLVHLVCIQ